MKTTGGAHEGAIFLSRLGSVGHARRFATVPGLVQVKQQHLRWLGRN